MKNLIRWPKRVARKWLAPGVSRKAKLAVTHPRWLIDSVLGRWGYLRYRRRHDHPVLLVCGLPKSGTTWMKNMLASYPGYRSTMIPEAISFEMAHGGTHALPLPDDLFDRLEGRLSVLKLHVPGTRHNAKLIHRRGIRYVVQYRDLRDVAVSHYFYVRNTPWHPEYDDYRNLDTEAGLKHFGTTLLPEFVRWIRNWRARRDERLSLEVRYEDLLADTRPVFQRVARHFGLDDSPETIDRIVGKHSFESVSRGRSRGKEDRNSFFRKGVTGDWKNHFTPELVELYRECCDGLLAELDYADNPRW